MLTNLEWLDPGQTFPPKSELPRLELYSQNEALFLNQQVQVWKDSFNKIARELKRSHFEVETIFNYQQLLSKKTADFVCGEPPGLEAKSEGDKLSALLRKQQFFSKLYEAFIDVSRFGNAVSKVVDNRVTIVSPQNWYPIVDPTDLKQVTQHVIAYPTNPDKNEKPTQLYVEMHTLGKVEIRYYKYTTKSGLLDSDIKIAFGEIGPLLGEPIVQNTGLNDFAVQPLTNVTHSSSLYGIDDYAIVNSLVAKLMWRLACADSVLNKHTEPSMAGPSSALAYDEKWGSYRLITGNYYEQNKKDDPIPQYITWNGNLESNFKEMDLLFNQLYVLSEMGTAFMEGGDAGGASSGTALKLRLVSPRIKAQRLTALNDAPVRTLIHILAKANSINIDPDDLQLTWRDGLPDDPVEDAGRRNVETAGKATKSQYSAIKERGLTDEETEAELEQMRLEAAASTPNALTYNDPTEEENPFPEKSPEEGVG